MRTLLVTLAALRLGLSRGEGEGYHWSGKNGDPRRSGWSPHVFKGNFNATPTWHHEGHYWELYRSGPLIDDELNIYLPTSNSNIWKFSKDGKMLWEYHHLGCGRDCGVAGVPMIYKGALYSATMKGEAFAVDMKTGKLKWNTVFRPVPPGMAAAVDIDSHTVLAYNGTVIHADTDIPLPATTGGRNCRIVGLNAEDGSIKWRMALDFFSYNMMAAAVGDGTMVVSDASGGLYRIDMETGERVWRSGYFDRSCFTTGSIAMAPEGIDLVIAAGNQKMAGSAIHNGPAKYTGIIHAYRVSDGQLLWQQLLGPEYEGNQAPAIGYLGKGKTNLSIVAAVGKNPGFMFKMWGWNLPSFVTEWIHRADMQDSEWHWLVQRFVKSFLGPQKAAVVALDAHTGEQRWVWVVPEDFLGTSSVGDAERLEERSKYANVASTICLPDSWNPPIIDGEGKVFVGDGRSGIAYQLYDLNGDGVIEGPGEVVESHGHDGWLGGMAQAPGMLAGAACGGGLKVWKY